MKLRSLATPKLADPDADRARRELEGAIREMQRLPATAMHVIEGVELRDGVETPVGHRLGRIPLFVRESCPRDATTTGRVVEIRSTRYDRSKVVVLKATGWGATITVDVMVA